MTLERVLRGKTTAPECCLKTMFDFKSVLSTHWTKLAAAGRQNHKEGLLKVGSKSDTAI
jgi:hypothetical protein